MVNSAGNERRERESGRTDSAHRLRGISDHLVAEFGGVPVVTQGENVIKALRPLKNERILPCPLHSPAVLPLRTSGMKQPTIPYKQAVNAHTRRSVRPSVPPARSAAAAPLVDIFRSSMWVVELKRKGEKKRTRSGERASGESIV